MNDLLHLSQTTRFLTASTVQAGTAIDNAREPDLQRAWKPSDSANDEWLKADGATTTWLGNAGATAYAVVAYDSRLADQTTLVLQYGTTDDGAFAAPNDLVTWTISGANALDVNCHYQSFTIPGTAKRWYRLIQKNADRGGLTRTARIFNWAMFSNADVLQPALTQNASEGTYNLASLDRTSAIVTAADFPVTNRYARGGARFEIAFRPASDTLWNALRDAFVSNGGMNRPIYIQKTGLRNPALPDFFMCRATSSERQTSVTYRGNNDIVMEFQTVPWI
jgi:hypothetical protein